MAEIVDTIAVRLKYSKTGAEANINANDFDPEKHARMDEVWPPVAAAEVKPVETPPPSGGTAPPADAGTPAGRRRGEPPTVTE